MDSAKKFKITDSSARSELEIQGFDDETEKFLKQIDGCQNEIEVFNKQSREEILKLEQRFNLLRKPHFDKRAEIISKIPKFWLKAFNNHADLINQLEVGEEDIIKYLINLDVEKFEDIKSGYRIHFYFEENPYFENTVLTKEFQLESSDGTLTSSSIPIRWKEGMDFTIPDELICTGQKRQLEHPSLFAWYNNNLYPASDTIADIIKDDLWQNPLKYFLVPVRELEDDEPGDQPILIEDEDETAE